MDTARSYTYMLKQPGGLGKVLIAGLLLFVPILGWGIVAGYMLRTMRAVALGDETLPEFSDWGDLFVKGIIVWVAGLIYSIPGAILAQLDALFLLSPLWSIAVGVFLPAATLRFAMSDNDFGAFFQFGEIWEFIQRNSSNYIMAVVMAFIAGIIASFGVILLIVGVVFTIAWAMLASSHLYGSVWRLQAAPQQSA